MTPQEAIDLIKIAIAEVEWNYPIDYAIAFQVATEALEKQIPKKPFNITLEYDGDYGKCPCCGRTVGDFHDLKKCHNCGQLLDWKGG